MTRNRDQHHTQFHTGRCWNSSFDSGCWNREPQRLLQSPASEAIQTVRVMLLYARIVCLASETTHTVSFSEENAVRN